MFFFFFGKVLIKSFNALFPISLTFRNKLSIRVKVLIKGLDFSFGSMQAGVKP
jgi:hypothetical protein